MIPYQTSGHRSDMDIAMHAYESSTRRGLTVSGDIDMHTSAKDVYAPDE
jgi:hypothetical protein